MKKEKQELQEEVSYSFMQKLLYLFIIPALFIITGVLIYLTYEGKNVFDMAKSFMPDTPNISETADKEIENNTSHKEEQGKDSKQIVALEREINKKKAEITKLTASLEEADKRIKDLEEKKDEVKVSTKELANLYERMSTKKAAQIITELDEEMALLILSELSVAKTSSILGQLEPDQAARFTTLLARNE